MFENVLIVSKISFKLSTKECANACSSARDSFWSLNFIKALYQNVIRPTNKNLFTTSRSVTSISNCAGVNAISGRNTGRLFRTRGWESTRRTFVPVTSSMTYDEYPIRISTARCVRACRRPRITREKCDNRWGTFPWDQVTTMSLLWPVRTSFYMHTHEREYSLTYTHGSDRNLVEMCAESWEGHADRGVLKGDRAAARTLLTLKFEEVETRCSRSSAEAEQFNFALSCWSIGCRNLPLAILEVFSFLMLPE